MTDLIDFVKLLTALVSLLTALIGLSEALKQRTKQKKRGRRHSGDDPLIEVTALPSYHPWAAVDLILPTGARFTKWIFGKGSTARPQNHYAPSAAMGITATPSSRV